MIVYIILIQDRHADVDAEVWSDKDKAIERARKLASDYCSHKEDYEESQIADWVFHATYSCEGDCVTVLQKELRS
jgi:hypothetical protein